MALAPVVLTMVASGAVSLVAIPKEVYLIVLLEGNGHRVGFGARPVSLSHCSMELGSSTICALIALGLGAIPKKVCLIILQGGDS